MSRQNQSEKIVVTRIANFSAHPRKRWLCGKLKMCKVTTWGFYLVAVIPNNSDIKVPDVPGMLAMFLQNSIKDSLPDCRAVVDGYSTIGCLCCNLDCVKEVLLRPVLVFWFVVLDECKYLYRHGWMKCGGGFSELLSDVGVATKFCSDWRVGCGSGRACDISLSALCYNSIHASIF